MTQEEKQLLLKDFCARLPYGCMLRVEGDWFDDEEREPYDCKLTPYSFMDLVVNHDCDVKPYLRSLSNMTEEEENEYNIAVDKDVAPEQFVDWYNLHHFNYRLPPHLFIEAPKGMYKIE